MLSFENDYSELAHEKILRRLIETNMEKQPGYGTDPYCAAAKEKIRKACAAPQAEVFFLVGGTQTNAVIIGTMLEAYEGVVAADTGHISGHEGGAVEFTGHKVLTLPQHDGKLDAGELSEYISGFYSDGNHEHMVFPGMVYISHPTEYGTLYTKSELEALGEVCRQFEIPLYMDGARLGYGLAAKGTDVTLPLIAQCCDVFYIGGTKVGALCGEAVVFSRSPAPKRFFTLMKQRGALLAKGRLLGVQFDTLFDGGLYLEISSHAVEMAELLKKGLLEKGYRLYIDSPTNQQFVVLDNITMERLKKDVAFSFWERLDEEHTVIRLATSWATTKEDVEKLIAVL